MKRKNILLCLLALALVSACSSTGGNSSIPQNSEASSQSQALESSPLSLESTEAEASAEESVEESSLEESSVKESVGQDSEEESSHESEEERQVYYTVFFDTDGGSEVASVSVLEGERIPQPAEPSKATKDYEYIFLGWYYNGEAWDFEKGVVMEDMTLVAKWKEGEHYTNPFLPKD